MRDSYEQKLNKLHNLVIDLMFLLPSEGQNVRVHVAEPFTEEEDIIETRTIIETRIRRVRIQGETAVASGYRFNYEDGSKKGFVEELSSFDIETAEAILDEIKELIYQGKTL